MLFRSLIDFGIARRFSPKKSKDTGPLGSPGYAAPEQYGSAQSNQKTDMYGLGATLQTLLTGRDPLELRLGQPSLRSKPLPANIQALLTSLLEADSAKRPVDMTTVVEDCERVNRRKHNALSFVKGALLGLPFPISFYLIAQAASFALGVYDDRLVLLYSAMHLIIFATLLVSLLTFVLGRKRNWAMGGFLAILVLTLILMLLNFFPAVPFIPFGVY